MPTHGALSKAELLKPKTKIIDVDGGSIVIRALSAEYGISLRGKQLGTTELFEVISKSVMDGDNAQMLTPDEVGQLALATVEQLVAEIFKINSFGDKAVADAVDELKKTTPPDLTINSPQP